MDRGDPHDYTQNRQHTRTGKKKKKKVKEIWNLIALLSFGICYVGQVRKCQNNPIKQAWMFGLASHPCIHTRSQAAY